MSDSIERLQQLVQVFVDERDWQRFHSPKNLSMAIAGEAAELMEHFQWIDKSATDLRADSEMLGSVAEEVADVLIYSLAMCNALGIDIDKAVRHKVAKNERKYPIEKARELWD